MSPYTQAVDAAKVTAEELGHTLGRTWVRGTTAELTCTVPECGATVRVFFHIPTVTSGAAVERECVRGKRPVAPPLVLHAPSPHASNAVPYNLAVPAGVRS